jgi:Xaa-Pro dipeptidase
MTVSKAPTADPTMRRMARVDRVRAECAQRGLSGLILTDQASLYYLFGYDQVGYWVFQVVYLPVDGQPVAVCRAPDAEMIRQTGAIADVRVWLDDSPVGPGEIVRGILGELGVQAGGRVGMELRNHCLLPIYYQAVLDATGGFVEIVEATDIVGDLRLVKDEVEISAFRRAADAYVAALGAARGAIAVGAAETDVHQAVMSTLYALGTDPPAIPPPIASGPRTATQTHGAATNRRIQRDELVVIEIGASVERYHAVGAMSFRVGAATDEARRTHDAMADALSAGFAAFRPGEPIAGICELVRARLADHGLSRAGRHVGYGTGIGFPPTWLESTRIKATEHRLLQPGMTFFYFLGISLSDGTSLYLGEPVLVTDDGYEQVAPTNYQDWQV